MRKTTFISGFFVGLLVFLTVGATAQTVDSTSQPDNRQRQRGGLARFTDSVQVGLPVLQRVAGDSLVPKKEFKLKINRDALDALWTIRLQIRCFLMLKTNSSTFGETPR